MRRRLSRRLGTPVASLLGAGVLALAPAGYPAPAHAAPGVDCLESNDPDAPIEDPTTDPSAPLLSLQVPQAQDLVRQLSGKEPGAGVQVAVVDAGVNEDVGAVPEVAQDSLDMFTKTSTYEWVQGTAVAGIIAGASRADAAPPPGQPDVDLVGVAPAATIYDLRIYDAPASDDLAPAESAGLAAGLERLVPLIGKRGIQIINVSLDVTRSAALDHAIAAVTRAGAIVVAAAGDRTSTDSDPAAAYELGEDRAGDVWPAGYARGNANNRVVAVSTTALDDTDDPTAYMVQSSAIDVAVPTAGAVSYGLNGAACTFSRPSSVVAAAEVSGILALLYTVYPDDSPDQVVARLEDTTTGGGEIDADHPDTRVGRGVVQPLEALNRALAPAKDGTLDGGGRGDRLREGAVPAALPAKDPDVLAGTRSDAVWWGLFGGGALLLAVLLRPVLSRRPARR